MPLWGDKDQSDNAPNLHIVHETSGRAAFANTSANTIIATPTEDNITIGLFGVDEGEALVAANSTHTPPPGPGWVTRMTYTDANGNARVKDEILVAMGSITLDANPNDAAANTTGTADDSVFPDA